MKRTVLLLLVALLSLSGCALLGIAENEPEVFPTLARAPTPTPAPGTTLPFEVLLEGASALYMGDTLQSFLLLPGDDSQFVEELFQEHDKMQFRQHLQSISGREALIAIFREHRTTGGYNLRMRQIVLSESGIYAYIELCDNQAPGSVAETRATSYFQVVETDIPENSPTNLALQVVAYPVNCR